MQTPTPSSVPNPFVMFSQWYRKDNKEDITNGAVKLIEEGKTQDMLAARSKFIAAVWKTMDDAGRKEWRDKYKTAVDNGSIVPPRRGTKNKSAVKKSPKKRGAKRKTSDSEDDEPKEGETKIKCKETTSANTSISTILKTMSRTATARAKTRAKRGTGAAQYNGKKHGPRGDAESTTEFNTTHNLCDGGFTSDEEELK